MATVHTYTGFINYPISNLNSLNFNEDALIELVIDDYGNGEYVNRKTTIGTFYDFLVSSHPIFNKIDDVYNDKTIKDINEDTNTVSYRYSSEIYISGQTYFEKNPYSYDKTAYLNLFNNQTVQKKQLEKYIHDNALEIIPIKNEDTIVQYGLYGWTKCESDSTNPRLDTTSLVKFDVPSNSMKFKNTPTSKIPLYHTDKINFLSNVFATIVGKIKLPNYTEEKLKYRAPYYSLETNFWVGIWEGSNLIAISELHNIEDNVAYFSFQLPMSRNIDYYFVIPFTPDTDATSQETSNSDFDLFSNIPINSVSIFYYSTGNSDNQKPETFFDKP